MPRLEFFVVARSFSVDRYSNRLSLFDIMELVQPLVLPAVIPRVIAVAAWHIEESDHGEHFQATIKLNVSGDDDNSARVVNQNFVGDGILHHSVAGFTNVLIRESGAIELELLLNNKHAASHRVYINNADTNAPDEGMLLYPEIDHKVSST